MSTTQYTIFNMNKKNTINYPKSTATGFFSKGLKNEFETAVVNEPSVFELLKFYCNHYRNQRSSQEGITLSVTAPHQSRPTGTASVRSHNKSC